MERKNLLFVSALVAVMLPLAGCTSRAADALNPFAESGPGLGQRNSQALIDEGGSGKAADTARHALEVMTNYRATQAPQPYYPAVQPAEVRLMWVPDHVNKTGDLVPAHYYYLRVLNDRWAVQDSFELEQQLESGAGAGTATPWTFDGKGR